MNKASSSLLVLGFAALLVTTQSFAQRNPRRPVPVPLPESRPDQRIIQERVAQHLRSYQRLRLADLLRLSQQEMQLEVKSLSLMAETLINAPGTLEILHLGRPIASDKVKKNLKEVKIILPPMVRISELELSATADIYIDSATLEVERRGQQNPYPDYEQQVQPNQMITLQVNQHVRGRTQLQLKQMVKQQLGLSLVGAEIERVIVQADPVGSRAASVQVELNNRLVGPLKFIDRSVERMPLPIELSEEVRSLQLVVNGDAYVQTIGIRVGRVRPQGPQGPQYPGVQRVIVNRQIAPRMDLELLSVLGYDSRMIRSITIEAQSRTNLQAQIALMGAQGFQGSVIVGPRSQRATLHLSRPMAAWELKLEASSQVLIEALEVEFVR